MARLVFACCLLLSIACGPSLKQAQTSVERYEQCYGADYNPEVTLAQRRRCWTDWLENHTESDAPERIRYAEMRLGQLSSSAAPRPLPDPDPEPPPTFQHEYPRAAPSVYPTSGCTPLCNDHWADCTTHCQMKDKDCAVACEASYRVCIEGCP